MTDTCYVCTASVVNTACAGRTVEYRGTTVTIPADLPIPTCTKCGRQWCDSALIDKLNDSFETQRKAWERGDRLVALAAAMGDVEEPDFSLIGRPTGKPLWSIPHQTYLDFQAARTAWHEAICFVSAMTDIVADANYQRIIAMGPVVLPLIFRDLATNGPDHWDTALTALTGVDPVDPSIYGDMLAIANAWLDWGRANGFEWACNPTIVRPEVSI